jgi:hypothetical protein
MNKKTVKTGEIIAVTFWLRAVVGAALIFGIVLPSQAQNIGGHMGFVLPLVTHAGGQTTNLGDNFSIGFPFGITVKGKGRAAFDMEFVPSIQDSPRQVSLTFHPGRRLERRARYRRGYTWSVRRQFVAIWIHAARKQELADPHR